MAERALWVTGRLGLHARAAANLVRIANQFQSDITLKRLDNSVEADAKSILSILMLAASRGTELRVVAAGPDEQAAVEAVFDLFVRDFDERELTEHRPDTKEEVRRRGWWEGGCDRTRCAFRMVRETSIVQKSRKMNWNVSDVVFKVAVRLSWRQLEAIKERAEKELTRTRLHF